MIEAIQESFIGVKAPSLKDALNSTIKEVVNREVATLDIVAYSVDEDMVLGEGTYNVLLKYYLMRY